MKFKCIMKGIPGVSWVAMALQTNSLTSFIAFILMIPREGTRKDFLITNTFSKPNHFTSLHTKFPTHQMNILHNILCFLSLAHKLPGELIEVKRLECLFGIPARRKNFSGSTCTITLLTE